MPVGGRGVALMRGGRSCPVASSASAVLLPLPGCRGGRLDQRGPVGDQHAVVGVADLAVERVDLADALDGRRVTAAGERVVPLVDVADHRLERAKGNKVRKNRSAADLDLDLMRLDLDGYVHDLG